ncbi:MAG TPA: hypothetical protein PLW83_05795, partial [Deltaproteobacteria bacterium]|nr:hypothetical protein [Deltaproteobacteria bacterium]
RYRRGLIGLIASSFRRIAVAAAVAGGIAALGLALVIFLSVRVSLLSRANEISVMKTLGASALFLFGPYALEGMLYGFLGSTTGLVTVTLSIRPFLEQNPLLSPLVRPQIVRHACVLIPFGTLCGLLGALAAAARGRNA